MHNISDTDNSNIDFKDISDCKFELNNYFYGKLMTVDDFQQEQNYFNGKRHLINRLINGTGVVCGLNVSIDREDKDNYYLQISSGLAIDCFGKEIVVPTITERPLPKSQIDGLKKYEKSNNSYGRFGVFLRRSKSLKSPTTTVLDNCAHEETCCNNRIAESFEVEFKKFEYPLKKLEFDNLVYDLSDKVKLELWDPDVTSDSIIMTISSANGNDSKEITLNKKKETNIFQTENEIELITALTNNITSDSNQLVVSIGEDGYDKITATYTKDTSDIVTTYATVLAEKFFLTYKNEMGDTVYRNENRKCSFCKSVSDSGYVLIAVIKVDKKNEIQIDNFGTKIIRKTVYNNNMLFDLLERYRQSLVEIKPDPTPTVVTLVSSGETQINIPKDFPRGSFKISDEIKFDIPKEYASDCSIPLVYLGRFQDKSTIGYTEDLEYEFKEEFDYEYYDEKEKISKTKNKKYLRDIIPEMRLLFKPISITKKSFRIIIMRHPLDSHIENDRNLSIMWWATFPSIFPKSPGKN